MQPFLLLVVATFGRVDEFLRHRTADFVPFGVLCANEQDVVTTELSEHCIYHQVNDCDANNHSTVAVLDVRQLHWMC